MNIRDESARCLLCASNRCTKACPQHFDPARMIRAVRFDNAQCAAKYINSDICAKCDGKCENSCIHPDFPIRIRDIAAALPDCEYTDEVNLEIDFFLSSSIVAGNYEMCAGAFRMGWAGAVLRQSVL